MKYKVSILLICFFSAFSLSAQVSLPEVFSHNMVLQQGKKVNIWGDAMPGEEVTVLFQKQKKKTVADENGKWKLQLDELTATKVPQQLIIRGKKNKIRLENVLIGEVWLASGQSNMEYSMNKHPHYAKPKKGDPDYLYNAFKLARNPYIRVLYVEKNLKSDTLPTKGWQMLNEESLAPVSAVAYFFAEFLTEQLDVPVGILSASWGGTPIETWTSEQVYMNSQSFKGQLKEHKLNGVRVGERYDKMIKPIIPYSLKGFLWYQGETNLINGDIEIYAEKQKVLIESWRSAWNDDKLSFYYVQLAPFMYSGRKQDNYGKAWDALPRFREVQVSCLNIPHTGMVSTIDLVENLRDIHPSYKWVVGERLARLALNKDYGKTGMEYCGPVFKKMSVAGNKITLEFDHVGSGLTTRDGKAPDWFTIKNKNGKFGKAKAVIEGDKIVIVHDQFSQPVSLRFGWDEGAMPNLMNKEGLPAVPFRTEETKK